MRPVLLSVLLLAIFSAAASAQGTFLLKRQEAEMTSPMVQMAHVYATGVPQCPPQLKGVPDPTNQDNRYYRLPLGDGTRYGVILAAGEGEQPLRLLVDTDGDNDLSDETPLAGTHSPPTGGNSQSAVTFPNATLTLGPGQTLTVRAWGATPDPKRPPQFLTLMTASYLTGTVKLGGKNYSLALVDGNMNGKFNDPLSFPTYQHRSET